AGYKHFHMEFEVVSGNVPSVQVEFVDWAEDSSSPEATDGKQREDITLASTISVIDFEITTDLSKGSGQIVLQFASAGAAAGDVEIVVHAIALTNEAQEEVKGYTSTNIANDGAITPNQYNNDKDTYEATLLEDGYHLSFTGRDNDWGTWKLYQYDSFAVAFNKDAGYTSFHMELEILDGNVPTFQVEFTDWADDSTSVEATDGYQLVDVEVTNNKVVVDFEITTDLSKGLGQIALKFASLGAAAGDVEIVVTNISLQ
ncbi:MAG: hypothetical protein MR270_01465, partial [Erysipelotrichaceae bacterium]|nr:hypothetical protein [Erysipelotrichaceae bacterium]